MSSYESCSHHELVGQSPMSDNEDLEDNTRTTATEVDELLRNAQEVRQEIDKFLGQVTKIATDNGTKGLRRNNACEVCDMWGTDSDCDCNEDYDSDIESEEWKRNRQDTARTAARYAKAAAKDAATAAQLERMPRCMLRR